MDEIVNVEHDRTFAKFIYSFTFNPVQWEQIVNLLKKETLNESPKPIKLWEAFSLTPSQLYPFVKDYLTLKKGTPPNLYALKVTNEAKQRIWKSPSQVKWLLINLPEDKKISFLIKDIHLYLFQIGVGFLVFMTHLEESSTFDDLLDFNHFFRFPSEKRRGKIQVLRKIGGDWEPYVLPIWRKAKKDIWNLIELIYFLLGEHKIGKWWCDDILSDELLAFASIFLHLKENSQDIIPELLYKIRTFTSSTREARPSSLDLDISSENHYLLYGDRMWFTYSMQGSVFVGINVPKDSEFFRNTLPKSLLPNSYFLLFLLTLLQRIKLMRLSFDVVDNWLNKKGYTRIEAFASIRDDMLDFLARTYFTQVSSNDKWQKFYRNWQKFYELDSLVQEVTTQIQMIHDALATSRTEKLNNVINIATFVLGPLAIAIGVFGMSTRPFEPSSPIHWTYPLLISLGILMASISFIWKRLK